MTEKTFLEINAICSDYHYNDAIRKDALAIADRHIDPEEPNLAARCVLAAIKNLNTPIIPGSFGD